MTDTKERRSGPIEVWLSKKNIEVTCTVVWEDETTTFRGVDSLSMRGAQREITGWLIGHGWQPVGRWEAEETQDNGYSGTDTIECMRMFKPGDGAEAI